MKKVLKNETDSYLDRLALNELKRKRQNRLRLINHLRELKKKLN
jgi:hypothetical protein